MKASIPAAVAALILVCAASQADAAGTYFRRTVNDTALPISNTNTVVVSVTVPAGNWLLSAVAPIQNPVDGFGGVACDIMQNGVSLTGALATVGGSTRNEITLIAAVKLTAAATIALGCRDAANTGHDVVNGNASLIVTTASVLK